MNYPDQLLSFLEKEPFLEENFQNTQAMFSYLKELGHYVQPFCKKVHFFGLDEIDSKKKETERSFYSLITFEDFSFFKLNHKLWNCNGPCFFRKNILNVIKENQHISKNTSDIQVITQKNDRINLMMENPDRHWTENKNFFDKISFFEKNNLTQSLTSEHLKNSYQRGIRL